MQGLIYVPASTPKSHRDIAERIVTAGQGARLTLDDLVDARRHLDQAITEAAAQEREEANL